MNEQQAIALVQKTFTSAFDRSGYIHFLKNLLNEFDEEGARTNQGARIPDKFQNHVEKLERVGKYRVDDHEIMLFIVYLKNDTSIERARTMQRNFVAAYLQKDMKDAALVAFVSKDPANWRFSFIKMEYRYDEEKNKIKEEFTPAKRWSFLVGANEASHTAQRKLVPLMADDEHNPTLADLEEAFNIEKVTKEFFEKYRGLFIRTKEALDGAVSANPKTRSDFESKGIDTVNLAKKLLGQIVFLYYLQKKGWFGVGRDAAWGAGSRNFLRELFEKKHGGYKNFFNDILEPLFYEALRMDRSHEDHYYSRFNCKIPFLNGGLFDPMNNYDWVKTDILLPNELFSNAGMSLRARSAKQSPNSEGIASADPDTAFGAGERRLAMTEGTGILDIFDRYNFTVKEDEPFEKEVAIDPELLGKAYEKFNAIRPDNYDEFLKALKSGKKGDESKFNKQYGVYYTPREIVHYMCQQSLINYLFSELHVVASERSTASEATPLFQEIASGREKHAEQERPRNDISKEDIATLILKGEQIKEHDERVTNEGRETRDYPFLMPDSIRQNASLLDLKLSAIKVCDPAVGSGAFPVGMMNEIVKARSVLDVYMRPDRSSRKSDGDSSLSAHGFGSTQDTLRPVRSVYAFKRECIENSLYGVDIDAGAVEIAKLRLWLSLVVDEDDVRNIKPLPNLDYKIVQGNSLIGVEKNLFNNHLFTELEALKPLYFNATQVAKKQEYKKQIDNLIDQITDGRAQFDFEIYFSEVFHEKGGFDVVIGNPPYGANFSTEEKAFFKIFFADVHIRTPDSFNYFISKSLRVLHKRAVLSFIVPSVLFFQNEYEKTRRLMLSKSLESAINFGDGVFDSATVPSCAFVLGNEPRKKYIFTYYDMRDHAGKIENLQKGYIYCDSGNVLDTPGAVFGVLSNEHDIIKKVAEKSYLIDEIAFEVAAGISTGGDKIFRITKEFAEENNFENPILHKVLVGGEIDKWIIRDTGHLLIYTQKKVEIEKYKKIYDYLKPFKRQLSQKRETRNGILPWWCLHWSRYPELFLGRKIIMRQTADSIRAVIDDNNNFVLNSILVLKINPNAPASYEATLAILNSSLNNFIYRKFTQEEGRTFAEVKPKNVRKLYIPKMDVKEKECFEKLVERILSAKAKNPAADTSQLEAEIDQLVYQLYGLTKEEIEIVEGR